MMFLFAVPVMEAMGVYLVPLMVGTRNIAFPRLNAFSYWVFLFGGAMLFVALVATGVIGFGLWVHHMFATGLPV
jgi:cytochrome c oxidase subunit 1